MIEVSTMLAFFSLGAPELIAIGVAAVLLFGRRLPEVGRSLGRGIVELKKGLRGVADEVTSAGEEEPQKPSETPPKTDDQ